MVMGKFQNILESFTKVSRKFHGKSSDINGLGAKVSKFQVLDKTGRQNYVEGGVKTT